MTFIYVIYYRLLGKVVRLSEVSIVRLNSSRLFWYTYNIKGIAYNIIFFSSVLYNMVIYIIYTLHTLCENHNNPNLLEMYENYKIFRA